MADVLMVLVNFGSHKQWFNLGEFSVMEDGRRRVSVDLQTVDCLLDEVPHEEVGERHEINEVDEETGYRYNSWAVDVAFDATIGKVVSEQEAFEIEEAQDADNRLLSYAR